MSTRDILIARIVDEIPDHSTGIAFEIMAELLAENPDIDPEAAWKRIKFAPQKQSEENDANPVPRSSNYDREQAGLEAIRLQRFPREPADFDRPASEYIERHQLEAYATSHFEKRIAQLAAKFSDDELARKLNKPAKTIRRTLTILAKRSGRELYSGPTLTREHDDSIRACVTADSKLFYVARVDGEWQIAERHSLNVDVGTLDPWRVVDVDANIEDDEARLWYKVFPAPAVSAPHSR